MSGIVIDLSWSLSCFSIVRQYFLTLKLYNMLRSILYALAVIFVIGWLLGLFVYNVGSLIHLLLVLAIISILLSFIGGNRTANPGYN